MADTLTFESLVALIKDVQPSLTDVDIKPEQSVVEDLGLDSLDLLQLTRAANREFGLDVELDEWSEKGEEHHHSVASLLDHFAGATV